MPDSRIYIFALRIALGWIFFYSGITKLFNPDWSAAGFLLSARTFAPLYAWFASPGIIDAVNILNVWGQLLIGVSLLLGICTRLGAISGVLLMILYYFPALTFPTIGKNYFLIDEHVVYTISLLLLVSLRAGHIWGVDDWLSKRVIMKKYEPIWKIIH